MTRPTAFRIGIPCQLIEKVVHKKGKVSYVHQTGCKIGKVQVKYVKDLSEEEAFTKIYEKAKENLAALEQQILTVSLFVETGRMLRISSELLPLIDHPEYHHHYDNPKMKKLMEEKLKSIGQDIQVNDIRVSCHPSQWITLFSLNKETIRKSVTHLNCWVRIFTLMGLSPKDGVVIVLHTNGQSFDYPEEANHLKDWLGLENDEKQAGFLKTLRICQREGIRMVLDVHHYRCETGMRFGYNSDEMYAVLATWNGKGRPKLHLSSSRGTENKTELCAHADMISLEDKEHIWEFAYLFDIMVEAKLKNIAAADVHHFIIDKNGYYDRKGISNGTNR